MKDTKYWQNYWRSRKKDWEHDLTSWDHPHRNLIVGALRMFPWISLFEIGCASGPNLKKIISSFKGKQLGGSDISKEAIEFCQKTFTGGIFKASPGDDVMMSDKSVDVVLTDMYLIYIGPFRIKKHIQEIKRLARNYVIICELGHTSLIKRLSLWWTFGYYAYNYKKLLEKQGFHDVLVYKMTEQDWPGGRPQKDYGHIYIAKVPKI